MYSLGNGWGFTICLRASTLHLLGVVNPLAMVGQDALWLDTFVEDFHLDKQTLLSHFFTGPTYQPWHWMGNLNGWGGPADENFLRQQLALGQNVTAAMVAYGMKPVLPAFAGHVPRQMQASMWLGEHRLGAELCAICREVMCEHVCHTCTKKVMSGGCEWRL